MTMLMARRKKMMSLALDPEVIEEMEAWLASQKMPPSKTLFVETAIREWLKHLKSRKQ